MDINLLSKSDDWQQILSVQGLLLSWGCESYVVGGWVRDNLLGKADRDIDFALNGDGIEIARRVAETLNGKYVPLDTVNRVARVILPPRDGTESRTLDFAKMNGQTVEEDLKRRDFSIDAIAVVPNIAGVPLKVIDPCRGLDDLDHKIVRATSGSVFVEDPIRLLRAVRIAYQLGFTVDAGTEILINVNAGLISKIAGERIREELVALLNIPGSGKALSYLDGLGLLTKIIPELEPGRETVQPREHHWNVLRHSLETAKAFDYLIREDNWDYAGTGVLTTVPWSPESESYFKTEISHGSSRSAILRLSAILHDIAKPETRTEEATGKVRFLGHAVQGAGVARSIMERLRFTNREIKFVEVVIKNHLRPTQMGWPELPSRRAVFRFCRDTGDAANGILYLSLADHLAMRGPVLENGDWQIHVAITTHILSGKKQLPPPEQMLIDGYDIMNIFGLSPSPRVGELLDIAHEAQASGQIASKDEAIALLKKVLDARS